MIQPTRWLRVYRMSATCRDGGRPRVHPSTKAAKCSRSRGWARTMKRRSARVSPKRSARDKGLCINVIITSRSTRAVPMINWSPLSDAILFTSSNNQSPTTAWKRSSSNPSRGRPGSQHIPRRPVDSTTSFRRWRPGEEPVRDVNATQSHALSNRLAVHSRPAIPLAHVATLSNPEGATGPGSACKISRRIRPPSVDRSGKYIRTSGLSQAEPDRRDDESPARSRRPAPLRELSVGVEIRKT